MLNDKISSGISSQVSGGGAASGVVSIAAFSAVAGVGAGVFVSGFFSLLSEGGFGGGTEDMMRMGLSNDAFIPIAYASPEALAKHT